MLFRRAINLGDPADKVKWDQVVSDSIIPDLKVVIGFMLEIRDFEIPRFVAEDIDGDEIDICVSTDGSHECGAARVWVRYPAKDGSIKARRSRFKKNAAMWA